VAVIAVDATMLVNVIMRNQNTLTLQPLKLGCKVPIIDLTHRGQVSYLFRTLQYNQSPVIIKVPSSRWHVVVHVGGWSRLSCRKSSWLTFSRLPRPNALGSL
jgi:hypothetical protein